MSDNLKVSLLDLPIGLLFSGRRAEAKVKEYLKNNTGLKTINCGTAFGAASSLAGVVLAGIGLKNENKGVRNVGILVALGGLVGSLSSWYLRITCDPSEEQNKNGKTDQEKEAERKNETFETPLGKKKDEEKEAFYKDLLSARDSNDLNGIVAKYLNQDSSGSGRRLLKGDVFQWLVDYLDAEKENMKKDFTDVNDITLYGVRNAISLFREFKYLNSHEPLVKILKDEETHPIVREHALQELLKVKLWEDPFLSTGFNISIYKELLDILNDTSHLNTDKQWSLCPQGGNLCVRKLLLENIGEFLGNDNFTKNFFIIDGLTIKTLTERLNDENEHSFIRAKAAEVLIRMSCEKFMVAAYNDGTATDIGNCLQSNTTPKELKESILQTLAKYPVASDNPFASSQYYSIRKVLQEMSDKNLDVDRSLLDKALSHIKGVYRQSSDLSTLRMHKDDLECLEDPKRPTQERLKALESLAGCISIGYAGEYCSNVIIRLFTNTSENEEIRTKAGKKLEELLNPYERFNTYLEEFDFSKLDMDSLIACMNNTNDKCIKARKSATEVLERIYKLTRNNDLFTNFISCAVNDKNLEIRKAASHAVFMCSILAKPYKESNKAEYKSNTFDICGFVKKNSESKDETIVEPLKEFLYALDGLYRSTEDTLIISTLVEVLQNPDCNPDIRSSVAYTLGFTGHKGAIDTLITLLQDKSNPKLQSASSYGLSHAAQLMSGGGISGQMIWLMGGNTYVHNHAEKVQNILQGLKPLYECIFDKTVDSNVRTDAAEAVVSYMDNINDDLLKESNIDGIKTLRESTAKLKDLLRKPEIDTVNINQFKRYISEIIEQIETRVYGKQSRHEQYHSYQYTKSLTDGEVRQCLSDLEFRENEDPTSGEIKDRYRKLAMKYHPDRNIGDKEAEARFKIVQEAYDKIYDWKVAKEKNKSSNPPDESQEPNNTSNELKGLGNGTQ